MSLVVLGLGVVVGAVGLVETLVPFVRTLTQSTTYSTPADIHARLSHGTYEVYQLTGRRSSSFSPIRPDSVAIQPGDVSVTSTAGRVLAVTPAGADETITQDNDVYTGAVEFDVPAAGEYVVDVRSGTPTRVILARSLGAIARSVAGWIAAAALGALVAAIGLVLLVVGLVRRRHRPVAQPGAGRLPPPDWYADPSDPSLQRYWDGHQWTDQTHGR